MPATNPFSAERARQFSTLAAAVDWLAGCLERDDVDELRGQALALAGRPADESAHFASFVFAQLQDYHRRLDLRQFYRDREFPPDADRFKLGGHMAELGCIHVDWIRQGQSWALWDVWLCR